MKTRCSIGDTKPCKECNAWREDSRFLAVGLNPIDGKEYFLLKPKQVRWSKKIGVEFVRYKQVLQCVQKQKMLPKFEFKAVK